MNKWYAIYIFQNYIPKLYTTLLGLSLWKLLSFFPVHEIFHDIVLHIIHLACLLSYCLLFPSLFCISHLAAFFFGNAVSLYYAHLFNFFSTDLVVFTLMQIENYNEPYLNALNEYDDGRDLTSYDFEADCFSSPYDDANKKKLAYRHRAIGEKYAKVTVCHKNYLISQYFL